MITKLGVEKIISGMMNCVKDPVEVERYYKCDIEICETKIKVYDIDGDLISTVDLPIKNNEEDKIIIHGFRFLAKFEATN